MFDWISDLISGIGNAISSALSGVWGWPFADEIARTVNAICVLLGALLGISTAEYRKGAGGE